MAKTHEVDLKDEEFKKVANGIGYQIAKIDIKRPYEQGDYILYHQTAPTEATEEDGTPYIRYEQTEVTQLCRVKDLITKNDGIVEGYALLVLSNI
ncbi:MAG: hypothetical protein PHW34_13285 [Hespellia sp.]|nr:hypothetical protein [Hespellia sp.]